MGEWSSQARGTRGCWGYQGVPALPSHCGLPGHTLSPQEQQQREHEEAMRDRNRHSESIEKAAVSARAEHPILPCVSPAMPWCRVAVVHCHVVMP